jgi:hypothetical protein
VLEPATMRWVAAPPSGGAIGIADVLDALAWLEFIGSPAVNIDGDA